MQHPLLRRPLQGQCLLLLHLPRLLTLWHLLLLPRLRLPLWRPHLLRLPRARLRRLQCSR